MTTTHGADGRVLDSRVVNPYSAAAEYQYLVDYDSAGRPVALSGKLQSQGQLTKVYEVVPSQHRQRKAQPDPVLLADAARDGGRHEPRRRRRLGGVIDGVERGG